MRSSCTAATRRRRRRRWTEAAGGRGERSRVGSAVLETHFMFDFSVTNKFTQLEG